MDRIPNRLKSRKFWLATLALLLVVLGQRVGINLDPAQLDAVIWIVAAYLGGQGITDAGKAQLFAFGKNVAQQVPDALASDTPTEDPK